MFISIKKRTFGVQNSNFPLLGRLINSILLTGMAAAMTKLIFGFCNKCSMVACKSNFIGLVSFCPKFLEFYCTRSKGGGGGGVNLRDETQAM